MDLLRSKLDERRWRWLREIRSCAVLTGKWIVWKRSYQAKDHDRPLQRCLSTTGPIRFFSAAGSLLYSSFKYRGLFYNSRLTSSLKNRLPVCEKNLSWRRASKKTRSFSVAPISASKLFSQWSSMYPLHEDEICSYGGPEFRSPAQARRAVWVLRISFVRIPWWPLRRLWTCAHYPRARRVSVRWHQPRCQIREERLCIRTE